MNKKQWVIDYLLITGFGWGMYLIWLVPFQLILVGLDWNQFITWIVWGTVLEMVFTYPIMKTMTKYGPRITEWVKENT